MLKANDGTDKEASVEGVTDGSVTLPGDDTFTREGYRFTGWNTSEDGSGQAYAPGDELELNFGAVHLLYAQWEKVKVPAETTSTPGAGAPSDKPVGSQQAGTIPVLAKTGSPSLIFVTSAVLFSVMGAAALVARRLKREK